MNFAALVFAIPINWVLLMLVIPVTARLSDSSRPPWREAWWKLGVTAIVMSVVGMLLHGVLPILGAAGEAIVLWVFLARWFDMEVRGVIMTLVGQRMLAMLATFIILANTASHRSFEPPPGVQPAPSTETVVPASQPGEGVQMREGN